jgi:hypothetical protein
MVPKSIEIDRDLQQVSDNDGPTATISLEMAGIAIKK